ncbi:FecR domain-containing protein [Fulvivirgaceae bacterium PWU4]|uniref:FecR domain-containing protein n=1 Tax=Chryseosolibacter histidini TaxID=2782349 RepID=A0AAP2DKI0_9BACT|nr:FecR domain-containing protein [Chryseosolibacter histidini]MBT1698073.1 FecR domain-containing protein [Chryseosolibacter histidini]
MRSDQERLKLVAAYLSGQLDAAERNDFELWINASPEHQRIFEEASRIWENSGAKLRLPVDETDRLWLELKSRMEQPEKVFSLWGMSATTLKVAASVVLVSLITYFLWPDTRQQLASDKTTSLDDISVSAGDHVATIYLPDSSRVWLNVNSRLTYAKNFGQAGRRASLEGEAFFEVTPDKHSPFTVATQTTLVTVVGTAFNLRQQGSDVTLTVSEGEVQFSGKNNEQKVAVKAGEKAVSANGSEPARSKNDDTHFEAWRRASNPEFEKEKLDPAAYLTARYTWRKNAINQSVIEGTVTSKAALADYRDVVLKITYLKPNGSRNTVRLKIDETVKAGARVNFQKRLFDIFTNTRSLEVEIESAAVATSVY